jgi:hypothetical protein
VDRESRPVPVRRTGRCIAVRGAPGRGGHRDPTPGGRVCPRIVRCRVARLGTRTDPGRPGTRVGRPGAASRRKASPASPGCRVRRGARLHSVRSPRSVGPLRARPRTRPWTRVSRRTWSVRAGGPWLRRPHRFPVGTVRGPGVATVRPGFSGPACGRGVSPGWRPVIAGWWPVIPPGGGPGLRRRGRFGGSTGRHRTLRRMRALPGRVAERLVAVPGPGPRTGAPVQRLRSLPHGGCGRAAGAGLRPGGGVHRTRWPPGGHRSRVGVPGPGGAGTLVRTAEGRGLAGCGVTPRREQRRLPWPDRRVLDRPAPLHQALEEGAHVVASTSCR